MKRFLLCLLLVPALSAWGADVPVSYTVDDRALKAAVSGTPLTFTLYSDSACTTSFHTQIVNSENVRIISKLKRFNPGGAVKPPKTNELLTTLTGVTAASPTYLKVTGTGITPVGGACQVQASGLAGPPGPPGPGFEVKDSNGATVGIFDGSNGALRNVSGTVIRLPVSQQGFPDPFLIGSYQTSSDCSGTQLVSPDNFSMALQAQVLGGTAYYPPTSGSSTPVNSFLYRGNQFTNQTDCDTFFGLGNSTFTAPNGCCQTASGSFVLGPYSTFNVSGFVPPFSLQ